ncbi:MAG: RecQ family ATP-dependent DNA helicase [Proteobacteria bacterium]|nr:RecQ family ATP-dependent DNA helicase [Pseudomonadota bacterium]
MVDPKQLLKTYFGFSEFRPGQAEVIGHLLAGRSAAAVFPTGSGKSLCYQLPALAFEGVTLVISPLLALMKDQIDRLQRQGIRAERLDSTQSMEQARAVTDALRRGELKMLYVAPERFNNERFREMIRQVPVALMTVDEAHCISEWGHNFRPDYLKLARFGRMCGASRILALTATATPAVLSEICRVMEIAPECVVRTGFYRSNLTLLTTLPTVEKRDQILVERLRSRAQGPAIVYVSLQKTAVEVANMLVQADLPAVAYHAGMTSDVREKIQEGFEVNDKAIIVATIAFGMGIDRSNIRGVYHYNLAKSLENYCQEIGRAGRDELPAVCEMLVCLEDLGALEEFCRGDTPTLEAMSSFVKAIFEQGDEFDVAVYELSKQHGIKPLVINTLLAYLELDNFLESGTPFYSKYRVRLLQPISEILRRFDAPRRNFLARVLDQGTSGRVWRHLDLDEVAAVTAEPRERVVRALGYLGDQGMAEVKAEGVRNRYKKLMQPNDLTLLARGLHLRAVQREVRELARLAQVVEMAKYEGCRSFFLARYFGEEREGSCGHCSWCLRVP